MACPVALRRSGGWKRLGSRGVIIFLRAANFCTTMSRSQVRRTHKDEAAPAIASPLLNAGRGETHGCRGAGGMKLGGRGGGGM